jgi:hypothetical protein
MNSRLGMICGLSGLYFLGKGLYIALYERDLIGSFFWVCLGILLLIEQRER